MATSVPLLASGTNNVLTNDNDRISYAIGMIVGRNLDRSFQQQELKVDVGLVVRAINDELSSNSTLLTQDEMQQTLTALQKQTRAKMEAKQAEAAAKRAELAAKSKADGEAFLATNKNNPGVVTLPDGLQYRVITNGDGAIPTPTDTVQVNYRGTLLDGTEFDSSFKRGKPATFPVTGVIHGWTEALLKMKVGSKWELFIPSDLAYGPQGRPGIPANAVLIFEVDLLSVQSAPPAAASQPRPATANQPLTSDIIKVPSAEELKKGAKIEVIKASDVPQPQPTNN
jgi:FKBP-type peptidyl-prolyl cis-trans isomerase